MEKGDLFQYLAPVESNCFQMNELIMLGASTTFILCSQELTSMAIASLSKQNVLGIKVLGSITEIVFLGREIVLEKILYCSSCERLLNFTQLASFLFPYSNYLEYFFLFNYLYASILKTLKRKTSVLICGKITI